MRGLLCYAGLRLLFLLDRMIGVKGAARPNRGENIAACRPSLASITQSTLAVFSRAVSATKYFAATFHAVSDDMTAAMIALGRHDVNRAFEAVGGQRFALTFNFERFVVVISAMCTLSHGVVSDSGFHIDILKVLETDQIGCSERKWSANFATGVLIRSDSTCSTIRSRISAGKRSTISA